MDGAVIPANQVSEALPWRDGRKPIWILNMGLAPGEDVHESRAAVDSLAFLTRQTQNVHFYAVWND